MSMKVVALEEHLEIAEVNDAWWAVDPQHRDDAFTYYRDAETDRRLLDLTDARLQHMDDSGVDVQVISLTAPGVQNLEPDQAVKLARHANDRIADVVRSHPDRLQGFATLPTPSPQAAADELRRAVQELGLRGAMVFGRTRERNLDHPDNEPIFAAASALRAPLYLHPQIPQRGVRDAYYAGLPENLAIPLATAGVGWHYEAGLQFVRLVLAGVLDRHPDVQIILGHWGEMMVFYLDRLDAIPRLAHVQHRPISEYFREHVYVTAGGVFSQRYLAWTIEVMGIDRVMFSVDYPYTRPAHGGARAFLEHALLSATDRERIAWRNWEDLAGRIRS